MPEYYEPSEGVECDLCLNVAHVRRYPIGFNGKRVQMGMHFCSSCWKAETTGRIEENAENAERMKGNPNYEPLPIFDFETPLAVALLRAENPNGWRRTLESFDEKTRIQISELAAAVEYLTTDLKRPVHISEMAQHLNWTIGVTQSIAIASEMAQEPGGIGIMQVPPPKAGLGNGWYQYQATRL